jgi:hypothetical protein
MSTSDASVARGAARTSIAANRRIEKALTEVGDVTMR